MFSFLGGPTLGGGGALREGRLWDLSCSHTVGFFFVVKNNFLGYCGCHACREVKLLINFLKKNVCMLLHRLCVIARSGLCCVQGEHS